MKKKFSRLATTAAAAFFSLGSAASAAPVTPNFDFFGNLTALNGSSVDFGGSGIPTNPAAVSTFIVGGETVRVGLIATPRFSSPTPQVGLPGTYGALPGESDPDLSFWNFSFYAESTGNIADAGLRLYYDLDPSVGNDLSTMGFIDVSIAAPLLMLDSVFEGSQNLGFAFLASDGVALTAPTPAPAPFNPFGGGEYSFLFGTVDGSGAPENFAAINVTVPEIPLPAGLPLMLAGLGALAWVRRFN